MCFEGVTFVDVYVCTRVQHQQPSWTSSTPVTCTEILIRLRAEWLTVVCSVPPKPLWQVTWWLIVTMGGKQHWVEQLQLLKQRSVVRCRGRGSQVSLRYTVIKLVRCYCFLWQLWGNIMEHTVILSCAGPCSAKKLQLSNRVKGCLGELLLFQERCKFVRKVEFCIFLCYTFRI